MYSNVAKFNIKFMATVKVIVKTSLDFFLHKYSMYHSTNIYMAGSVLQMTKAE